jgi:TRAP-type C4-dicarboxylate transport system permease small subunit
MPKVIKLYVRYVDAVNRVLGNVVMFLALVMMGVLLFASLTRYVFNVPFVWIIEMAQFLMAAYYILGGGYSMQLDAHVRMAASRAACTPSSTTRPTTPPGRRRWRRSRSS